MQIARFAIVGVANTIVSFATFRWTYTVLQPYAEAAAIAQLCAYGMGVACSFTLSRRWTFGSDDARAPELIRFLLSQIAMLVLSSVALQWGVATLRLPPTPMWLVTTGGVAVLNYLALRRLVFRARGSKVPRAHAEKIV